ncbi:hypothetical protein Pse7367_1841 [Thalassoporum mexicanum PCC 7367]|uniref:hypothetical protein n=1 Tax=Thalassoporum mexicanum TaxID=3457544 RepID=UPI00029FE879|nr:hypothetical protein [Pseudanabaena sp. PCC 7367]AFY70117.1 hypothetical protein Pse7367_1841 [Pseudanabaena sp. PCC 7367]
MTSSKPNPEQPQNNAWEEVEVQISQAEYLLQDLKQKLAQVKVAQDTKTELQKQQQKLEGELDQGSGDKEELKQQVDELSKQIESIETELASRFISWRSFREPFWQIVRFAGVGVLVGVLLKSCAA